MSEIDDTVLAERPETQGGPRRDITVGETTFTLLGTAHVSAESADEVRSLIDSGDFDAVAIELCDARHSNLANPDALRNRICSRSFARARPAW